MFIDKVRIKISSGKGGNGANTFRQEKFVAYGGPDGGDGGRGGSVYLEASNDLSTLLDFKYKSFFKADDGDRGANSDKTGRSAKDLIIKVPVGTIVRDPEADINIADLKEDGQRVLLAEGGRGGRGNAKFKSNKIRVPNFSEPGDPAIERELELELKMIADVGIIGFPNAGKSTLISKVSAAKPKIADYAFTTLVPNLGVVRREDDQAFVMADIPGLIEGASEGQGLGHKFLRHVERTRLLIHMIDVWGFTGSNVDQYTAKGTEDPLNNFVQINYELDHYSKKLSSKKQIIVLNKIEGYPDEELTALVKRFEEYTGLKLGDRDFLDKPENYESNFIGFFAISTMSSEGFNEEYVRYNNGLTDLKRYVEAALDLIPREELEVEVDFDPVATDHDDSGFVIEQEPDEDDESKTKWLVHCGKLERLMKITNLKELDSLNHLFYITKAIGVISELKALGAAPGDTLNIDGVDFEVTDAVLL